MGEIDDLAAVLGCSQSDADHYLRRFDGDFERTVQNVLDNRDNKSWWAHPWNATDSDQEDDRLDTEFGSGEWAANEEQTYTFEPAKKKFVFANSSATSESKEEIDSIGSERTEDGVKVQYVSTPPSPDYVPEQVVDLEELLDDESFYRRYGNLVDAFVNAVCQDGGTTKGELRDLIAKADARISRDTGEVTAVAGISDLVNRLSFRHKEVGRTPLSYAVAKNLKQKVYDLIDLGAHVSKVMPQKGSDMAQHALPTTALVIAATNERRDGTEMLRILLSKGASPKELETAEVDEALLGLGKKYWIDKAKRIGVPDPSMLRHLKNMPPMDRLHELDYAVVGEEAAVSVIKEALAGRFGNPQANTKPLVLLLLGPPGHGKTYLSANAARTLVGEENFLFVPCQSIRDDADLFGSRLGGSRGGEYSSDGQLTAWLRKRQNKKCIVFLDEFEKIQGLTSSLGWDQAKKIYQSFLEPWNDGTLSDQGARSGSNRAGSMASTSAGGDKIDCSQCIWILTANWGQRDIIDFCEKNKSRLEKKVDHKDAAWIKKNLVSKILDPLVIRELGAVHQDIKALRRRVGAIVPFLPFTKSERKVVADIALAERFSLYREPCVLKGPEEKRRSFGNLRLRSTRAFAAYAAKSYDPMQGASVMLSLAQQADGKFQMMHLHDQLSLTPGQKERICSPAAPVDVSDEPNFWVHYDRDSEEIGITQTRPPDDDEHSQCSADDFGGDNADVSGGAVADAAGPPLYVESNDTTDTTRPGAADDAF